MSLARKGTYQDFVQRVRRHRPTEIIAACGAESATIPLQASGRKDAPPRMPDFALAGITRAAIVHGNEHRENPVTERALLEMTRIFINIEEPFTQDNDLRSFWVRMGSEQFPYQALPFIDLARTRALLVDAAIATSQTVVNPAFWSDLLGCSLDEFVGVSMFLYTSALKNSGKFNPGWLNQRNFEPIFSLLAKDVIEQAVQRNFIQSREEYREIAIGHPIDDPTLKRYSFNPILVKPFVQIGQMIPIGKRCMKCA